MSLELPTNYDNLSPQEKRSVRERYIILQGNRCCHCGEYLNKKPCSSVRNLDVDESLFPENFFKHPVHLHHNHDTGMTIGAVHCFCNAVLWQYYGE